MESVILIIKENLKNETENENEEKQNSKHHSHSASRSVLYPGRESNPHSEELDFESSASTNSATWACFQLTSS